MASTDIDLDKTDYIKAFMPERPVDFGRAVLVVIDMQYATGHRTGALSRRLQAEGKSDLVAYRFGRIHDYVIPNTQRLLAGFRSRGGRVLYIKVGAQLADASDAPIHMQKLFREMKNVKGSRENEIVEELASLPGEAILDKTTNGAFASCGIDSLLRAWSRDQLYMVGVSTNMCVESTGREAADRGYAVTLIEDACGTTQKALHEGCMVNFQRLFGRVRSTEQVMTELGLATVRQAAE